MGTVMLSFIAVKLSTSHLLEQGEFRKFSFCFSQFMQKTRFCCGQRIELRDHPLHGDTRYVER